jgi:hypothetical protein
MGTVARSMVQSGGMLGVILGFGSCMRGEEKFSYLKVVNKDEK